MKCRLIGNFTINFESCVIFLEYIDIDFSQIAGRVHFSVQEVFEFLS